MSALSASALSAAEQPAIYSEEGRALKKRLELKKKLEKRRAEEAAAALGEDAAAAEAEKAKAEAARLATAAAKSIEEQAATAGEAVEPSKKKQTFAQFRGKALTVSTEKELSRAEARLAQSICRDGPAAGLQLQVFQ